MMINLYFAPTLEFAANCMECESATLYCVWKKKVIKKKYFSFVFHLFVITPTVHFSRIFVCIGIKWLYFFNLFLIVLCLLLSWLKWKQPCHFISLVDSPFFALSLNILFHLKQHGEFMFYPFWFDIQINVCCSIYAVWKRLAILVLELVRFQ